MNNRSDNHQITITTTTTIIIVITITTIIIIHNNNNHNNHNNSLNNNNHNNNNTNNNNNYNNNNNSRGKYWCDYCQRYTLSHTTANCFKNPDHQNNGVQRAPYTQPQTQAQYESPQDVRMPVRQSRATPPVIRDLVSQQQQQQQQQHMPPTQQQPIRTPAASPQVNNPNIRNPNEMRHISTFTVQGDVTTSNRLILSGSSRRWYTYR